MSDLADVENTIKAMIVGWVYPSGTTEPSAILQGSTHVPVKVGRGWPVKTALEADLANNIANISIYSQPGSERNTSRFPKVWQTLTNAAPTITIAVSGQAITLGGTVSTPQNVAAVVNGIAYVYPVQSGDTLSTIASGLASLISPDTLATSTGPVITVSGTAGVSARVGGQGQLIRELRRQERLLQVTAWCNTPEQRDAVAGFIDGKFAGVGSVNGLEFFNLPDGSAARLLYVRTQPTDKDELSGAFRRDLIYSVEYGTTETQAAFEIVTAEATLSPTTINSTPTTVVVL